MGSRGAYTHTQSKGAFLTCVLSRYDVPVQRKLIKPGQGACRRYQLCLPLPVWVLEVPQLPLVDNETQPLCSTRPGTRFTDEWAGRWYCLMANIPALGFEPSSLACYLLGKHASVETRVKQRDRER